MRAYARAATQSDKEHSSANALDKIIFPMSAVIQFSFTTGGMTHGRIHNAGCRGHGAARL